MAEDFIGQMGRLGLGDHKSKPSSEKDDDAHNQARDVDPFAPWKASIEIALRDLKAISPAANVAENAPGDLAALGSQLSCVHDIKTMARKLETCAYVEYLVSLSGRVPIVLHLLSTKRFRTAVETIVRVVLGASSKIHRPESGVGVVGKVVMCILEECYKESLEPFGVLHVKHYLKDILSWDHYLDDSEVSPQFCTEVRRDSFNLPAVSVSVHEKLMRFWIEALSKQPDGPVLFWPLAVNSPDHIPRPALEDPPRYLFRAYDRSSSGTSNDSVIASLASKFNSAHSHVDLLSLDRTQSSDLLRDHLSKSLYGGSSLDNLMSWSSSLLFVIQYAVFRCRGDVSSSDVKICAVDTTKFPKGTFARDIWLLKSCSTPSNRDVNNLLALRTSYNGDWDNGEYLSQGSLYHGARSCTFTLQTLLESGLSNLYPEFNDPSAKAKWAKRALELRTKWRSAVNIWVESYPTPAHEVKEALRVASTCFPKFERAGMAILLLAFKNRIHQFTDFRGDTQRYSSYGPIEVSRSYEMFQAFKVQEVVPSCDDSTALEKFFCCITFPPRGSGQSKARYA